MELVLSNHLYLQVSESEETMLPFPRVRLYQTKTNGSSRVAAFAAEIRYVRSVFHHLLAAACWCVHRSQLSLDLSSHYRAAYLNKTK